ncbi:MAG: CoA transferase [Steroidobacteraceae bacterium]
MALPGLGSNSNGQLPLRGIRIANFGWGWVGPVAGQTLSFLGADVYKIESRARVDINRTLPPFAGNVRDVNRSIQNHATWAGNGSITLDLKKPAGRELARRFVTHCDVVIENFGPGVIEKLGLGYKELQPLKPDIIFASMPAAGLSGPLKNVRTYGMSLSSITGVDSLTGYVGGPPVPMENAYADPLGGIIGALAVMLALHHRRRTGRGQLVDFSQQEGILQLIGPAFMDYVMNQRVAAPMGNRHPTSAAAPHGVFPCMGEDRWISIAIMSDDEWQNLCLAMGSPNWSRTDIYAGAAGRVANIDILHEHLAAWTCRYDDRALAELLQRHGVAAAPVLNVADLLNDPHYRARGTFIEVTHPLGFKETIYGSYVKASRSVVNVRPGPVMGQDNDTVFLELMGLPDNEYRRYIAEQVIY